MIKKIVCHDLQNNEFEIDSDKLSFRPSVYGILIEGDKVLLSKQWDGYDMPGGGMKIYETLEDALKREFLEETGLIIEVSQIIHCETSFFNPNYSVKHKEEFWNCPLMYFLVKKIGGEISKNNFDEDEKNYADLAEWIELEKISQIKFFNSVDSVTIIEEAEKRLKAGF